jgi:hypothetical protein
MYGYLPSIALLSKIRLLLIVARHEINSPSSLARAANGQSPR